MSVNAVKFPKDFLWGSATAAYQIEGGAREGGRGASIWDTFSHTPGRTFNGDTGDIACDHYHLWEGDLDELYRLGVNAYRFSVSWSRILPYGRGDVNEDGLVFYERIINGLIKRNIKPVLTLYHWDLPQALEDEGGWTNRATASAFADYARILARRFGKKIHLWTTINEPWCSAFLGYAAGVHAPGHTNPKEALAAVHHLNLAHGMAISAIREELGEDARVSVTVNLHVVRPEDPNSDKDLRAVETIEALANGAFLGPMLEGVYPHRLREVTAQECDWSFIHDGDCEITRAHLDVLGVNYYSPVLVRACEPGHATRGADGHGDYRATPWIGAKDVEFCVQPGPYTHMGWPIDASGLSELLIGLSRRYQGLALMVTENGAAFADPDHVEDPGGAIHDPQRVAYLHDHIGAVKVALDAGVPVRGYFAWSLMDNFEWAYGYSKRFGIIHVDYETRERRWKDSAHWYSHLVRTGVLPRIDEFV